MSKLNYRGVVYEEPKDQCQCDGGHWEFPNDVATSVPGKAWYWVERIHGVDGIENHLWLCDECAAGTCGYMEMCESIIGTPKASFEEPKEEEKQ